MYRIIYRDKKGRIASRMYSFKFLAIIEAKHLLRNGCVVELMRKES